MIEEAALIQEIAFDILIGIVTSLIGLYIGSIARKPTNSRHISR
jgi:hypothetical protein